ncbi:MAG: hypothetical protein QG606_296 [Patescibacteria group bacterium]|jgi:hypothetical protein|nr:hypothetical protein [Patescibacteria group bacterium]
MFSLIKHLLWLIHIGAIFYFSLKYIGYDVNWHYFDTQKKACEARLTECRQNLIKTGIEGAKETCDWKCADISPKLLIQKKEAAPENTSPEMPKPTKTPENATIETP